MKFSELITYNSNAGKYYITIPEDLLSEWKTKCNGSLILSLLAFFLQCLMEIELIGVLGSTKGKHSESRADKRNGYERKTFSTLIGDLCLSVPRLRSRAYRPFFQEALEDLEKGRKSLAIFSYICGITTRYVGKLFKKVGIRPISKSAVSEAASKYLKELSEKVNSSDLSLKKYPVVFIDALYETVRIGSFYQKAAVIVVSAVDEFGKRCLLSVTVTTSECKETYQQVLYALKERGLQTPSLVVSDAHKGIVSGMAEVFPGALWQRCAIHLKREAMKKVKNASNLPGLYFAFNNVLLSKNYEEAEKRIKELKDNFSKLEPAAVSLIENGIYDSITFLNFPGIDYHKIYSTNIHERFNRTIRKRTSVSEIYPTAESYSNLVFGWVYNFQESWSSEPYLSSEDANYILDVWERRERKLEEELDTTPLPAPKCPDDVEFVYLSSDSFTVELDNFSTTVHIPLALGMNGKSKKQILSCEILTGHDDGIKYDRFVGSIKLAVDTDDIVILQECGHPELEAVVEKNFSPESLQFDLKSFIPVAAALVPENNRKTVEQNLRELAAAKDYGEAEGIFQSLLGMYESALPELAGLLEKNFPCFFRYAGHADFGRKLFSTLRPLSGIRKSIKEIVRKAAGKASGLGSKVVSYLSGRNEELARKISRPARRRAKKAEESRNVQKTQAAGQEEPSANNRIVDSVNINGLEVPNFLLDFKTIKELLEGASML